MPWLLDDDDEHGLLDELFDYPDRMVGLLAPVLIDRRLEKTIQALWQDDGSTLRDLFRDGAPLGSFATRIKIGFAIGLYGKETYQDLREINHIRNAFAHQLAASDFQFQSIRDRTKKLSLPTRFPATKEMAVKEFEEVLRGKYDNMFQFASRLVSFSSIAPLVAINSSRGRFLRTVEILLIFLGSEMTKIQVHRKNHPDEHKPNF
jgi:DNA-binding MltR family transcriptional regulator